MGCLCFSLLALKWLLSLTDKAVMAPNLDSFGRDRAAYQEHSRQRRIAEREARRYEAHLFSKDVLAGIECFCDLFPVKASGPVLAVVSAHEMPKKKSRPFSLTKPIESRFITVCFYDCVSVQNSAATSPRTKRQTG